MNSDQSGLPEKEEKQARRIAWLFHVYIRKTITETEQVELDEWVSASLKNQVLFEQLTDPGFIEKSMDSIQMINDFLHPN